MDRLSLYIARQLAGPYVLVLLTFICLITILPSLRLVDLVLDKGISGATLAELLIYYAPRYLAFFLPFLVFLATVIAYARLSIDSELVALQSVGRSSLQLAGAAIAFAVVVAVISLTLELYAGPAGYHRYRDKIVEIRNSYASFLFRDSTFISPVHGLTVFVRERDPDGNLTGILLHDERDPSHSVSILAERGRVWFQDGVPHFQMFDGNHQEVDRGSNRLSTLSFRSYQLNLGAIGQSAGIRAPSPAERSIDELLNPPEFVSEATRWSYAAEAHRRIQAPLLVLLMALAGATPLLLRGDSQAHPLRPVFFAIIVAVALEAMFAVAPWLYATEPAMIPFSYVVILAVGTILVMLLTGRLSLPEWPSRHIRIGAPA